jgi:hypothetical protein
MGWAQVCDQGLAGLVLQLLKGGSTDVDRQGYSCGEGYPAARATRRPGRSASRRNTTSRMRCISFFPAPLLAGCGESAGARDFGEPALGAPAGDDILQEALG